MNFEKIRNLANKKTTRAVATALFFLAGKTATASPEGGPKDNAAKEIIALNTEKQPLLADAGTYFASGREMREMEVANNFELVKLDFDVNYETDKADLAERPKEEIIQQFATFLSNINQTNFPAVKEAAWQVVSSCDERPTNLWGEKGNEALATARGAAVIDLLQEYLKKYEFSGLSAAQIKDLKNKNIENAIVTIHEDRKGETLITDIINPETGDNYTPAEAQKMKQDNPERYASLLAQNRISQFRAEIPVLKLEKMGLVTAPEPIPEKEPRLGNIETPDLQGLVKMFPEYKNIILLLDNSPSMRDDKQLLSEELSKHQSDLTDTKFFVGHYSDRLQKLISASNSEASREILDDVGSGSDLEASVQAPAEAWDKIGAEIKPDEKTLILVNTDEALQRFSSKDLEVLQTLPANVEIKFVFHLGEGRCLDIPLSVVQNSFDKETSKGTSVLKKSLADIEGQLSKLHVRQLNTSDREAEKHLKKLVNGLEKRQADITARLLAIDDYRATRKISLHEFTDKDGKTVKLHIY